MRRLIAVAALLLLAGCQSVATTTFDPSGAQKGVFALKSAYAVTLTAAVTYTDRPRCGRPTSPVLCSEPSVVAQLRKADNAAFVAIDAAETAVRSLSANPTVVEAAVKGASGALDAFKAVVSIYK